MKRNEVEKLIYKAIQKVAVAAVKNLDRKEAMCHTIYQRKHYLESWGNWLWKIKK